MRLKARVVFALLATSSQLGPATLAASPASMPAGLRGASASACNQEATPGSGPLRGCARTSSVLPFDDPPHLTLPAGGQLCPASGPSASCNTPIAGQPTDSPTLSNVVTAAGFGVTLATSSSPIVGPGKPVTFTATATGDVSRAGFQLGLYDQASGARLTYCSQGTTCSTTLTKSQAGARSIVAYVADASETLPPPAIQAKSAPITATWLGVTLDANTHPQRGSTVVMRATANVDVTNTPWSIGIYNEQGALVSDACKSGSTCTAQVTLPTGSIPWFTAVIGATKPASEDSSSAPAQFVQTIQMHSSLVNIQARSAPTQPARLLWGVDSCRALTSGASSDGLLYAQVYDYYGKPDFWGRYLTSTYNCPGISSTEIAAAANRHMGILPIYDDYDCSAVHGYDSALRYANEASAAAANLGIPQGTGLAVDIEPPGPYCPGAANVDAGFITGWYDGITLANYAPLYYGNGTAGSEFGSAWCRAATDRPEIAANSYLWSFEPSLLGRFTKARSPEYWPEVPGCPANVAAWQYALSSGSKPDVDSDQATSKLPLWYPELG